MRTLKLLCLAALTLALALPACRSTSDAAAEGGSAVKVADAAPRLAPVVLHDDQVKALWAPSGKASVKIKARGDKAFVAILRMDPGASVPRHQDDSEEYIHVLAGSGRMVIDGKAHEVGPGTTVFMPGGSTVTYDNGDAELVALQVFADPTSAAKYDKWLPAKP